MMQLYQYTVQCLLALIRFKIKITQWLHNILIFTNEISLFSTVGNKFYKFINDLM